MNKIEFKLFKVVKELAERSKSGNFGGFNLDNSEIKNILVKIQEEKFEPELLIKSNIGRYCKALENVFERIDSRYNVSKCLKVEFYSVSN